MRVSSGLSLNVIPPDRHDPSWVVDKIRGNAPVVLILREEGLKVDRHELARATAEISCCCDQLFWLTRHSVLRGSAEIVRAGRSVGENDFQRPARVLHQRLNRDTVIALHKHRTLMAALVTSMINDFEPGEPLLGGSRYRDEHRA